ncbi:cupin domain-containing protein [Roseovarius dicentrarchi]|uniref:cupin domain-containing protein n=1 Tax=Roseovarius dicentrarchi TaxID=2250573 RepID=UPI000DEB9B1D|nr:cupin domain-containing protein [Roseovarius dicentrarchi]
MELNSDFSQAALVHSDRLPWHASPSAGVSRRMLDRIGDEVARATSIVRFDAGHSFVPHTHGGGEEFVVLEGVFQDEHGDYPAGTYVRNPPTSRHTPRSDAGCTIFVKLWQFAPEDRHQFRKDMRAGLATVAPGVQRAELHKDAQEVVSYTRLDPGAALDVDAPGGIELLVLEGALTRQGGDLRTGSWLRLPEGQELSAVAGANGAALWMKTGHLRHVAAPDT